ncbi:MAG: FmdB family zinc ribbon protein [Planctomycetota bacterium]|jgi:putative FmdB family regulatory protein
MPIFEYTCKKCGELFEELVRSDTVVECPKCGSQKVEKELSVFSAASGGGDDAPPPCFTGEGGCGMGKCGSGRCGIE